MNELEIKIKDEIKKFFFAIKYGMKPDRKVRWAEEIKAIAQKYEGNDNWINKFKNGETIKNNFGAKLYFKFGGQNE